MKSEETPVLSAPGFIPDNSNETNIERDLSFHLVRVVEQAAVACARTMGQGNAKESDHAAVHMHSKPGPRCAALLRTYENA
jgi:Bacterial fructose-1,6-bisphosphatase, glpX-encoded